MELTIETAFSMDRKLSLSGPRCKLDLRDKTRCRNGGCPAPKATAPVNQNRTVASKKTFIRRAYINCILHALSPFSPQVRASLSERMAGICQPQSDPFIAPGYLYLLTTGGLLSVMCFNIYFLLFFVGVLIVSTTEPFLSFSASLTGLNFPVPASRPIFFVPIFLLPVLIYEDAEQL